MMDEESVADRLDVDLKSEGDHIDDDGSAGRSSPAGSAKIPAADLVTPPLPPLQDTSSEDDKALEDEADLSDKEEALPLISLPMPDLSDFEVPLPAELQSLTGEEISDENITSVPKPLAPLPNIIHVPDLLKPLDSNVPNTNVEGVQIAHVGRDAGLTGDLQATYLRLPPGTRTTRPVAQRLGDSITYCISGRGLLWQNGWTFPMNTSDAVGWKAGTGITHTIINDSNHDGSSGEDLLLLVAHEVKQDESFSYPLDPEMDETTLSAEGKSLWKDAPVQGEFGPHPGIPSVSNKRGNQYIPEPQKGYRPSNIVNAIAELDSIGDGDMFANATSLSQETGLSGRFGCNFEVPPPGARSSDPHAHSLEDELVYIVSGTGLVWLNGHVHPVREGDAVGFPGGTGIAHNFINDSNANGEEGEPLILWIIGQNKSKIGDMVYYPLHTAKENKFKRWWADCPKYEIGPHNGKAQRPLK